MIGRIFSIAVIVAAGYWYWTGPYQAKNNPSYEARLQQNGENMTQCIRGLAYREGATGESSGNAEESCAEKYNLYQYEGKWHSYDEKRRDQ